MLLAECAKSMIVKAFRICEKDTPEGIIPKHRRLENAKH